MSGISGNQTAQSLANTVGEVGTHNQTSLYFLWQYLLQVIWKYILLLNKPLLRTSASNLLTCCKVYHDIYCIFFRKQLPVYYAFYAPSNTKHPFLEWKPSFEVGFGFCPNFSHWCFLLKLTVKFLSQLLVQCNENNFWLLSTRFFWS